MSKSILLPKRVYTFLSKPFSFLRKDENQCYFSGGIINTISNQFLKIQSSFLEKSEEFFLNIKSKPLSPKIHEVKILSKEEVLENKNKEDDLLNIYLPIAKQNSFGEIVNYNFLNSNFNFVKKSNEKRMTGYFYNEKVYLSGFIVFGPSGEIIEVVKPQEINAKEGDIICISISVDIKYKEDKKNDLNFGNAFIEINLNPSFKKEEFSTLDGDEPLEKILSCSCSFPIGVISGGNYVALSRGNVKISLFTTSFIFYSNSEANEAIFETKNIYSIIPNFI